MPELRQVNESWKTPTKVDIGVGCLYGMWVDILHAELWLPRI